MRSKIEFKFDHVALNLSVTILFTWQSLRIVDALSGSGFRYLGRQYREPGRRGAGLFLESTRECVFDVLQPESTYGRSHQTGSGRGEHAVEKCVVVRYLVNALCM